MQKEQEEQRAGRNKATTINSSYIESGSFRRKFDKISDNKALNRLLYRLAKKMLYHRSGTCYEDMYWIDITSCEIMATEIEQNFNQEIQYSEKTKMVIKSHSGLLTIHSHPMGFPPSVEDLNSNYTNDYGVGIVIGHTGRVFLYYSNEFVPVVYFGYKVASYRLRGYNEYEAREKTLQDCCDRFDVVVKEVLADE
ncbi:hypothetical protein [Butyrivibrio sp. MC2021]|uniref:hypothetical protein n=1 Tax=Butyrivibrio sp. MC2021 TaxID=1408306 RepID=UPI00047DC549|nr:hypothetical protein [Butyrivibrio sp. MC2021]